MLLLAITARLRNRAGTSELHELEIKCMGNKEPNWMFEATEDAGFEHPHRTGPRPSADADTQIETAEIDFEDEAACVAIFRLMDAYAREPVGMIGSTAHKRLIPADCDHPRTRVLLAWNGQVHVELAV